MNNQRVVAQGSVHVWGRNGKKFNQCGVEGAKTVLQPRKIPFSQNVMQVACGDEHTIFLTGIYLLIFVIFWKVMNYLVLAVMLTISYHQTRNNVAPCP